jgi:hypothetical protein
MKNHPPFPARGRAFGLISAACLPALVSAQTAVNTFESGLLSPFSVEVRGGNTAQIVTTPLFPARSGAKVHRLSWHQANYVGTRETRGVEGSSGGLQRIKSEGWYAFSFRLAPDFPAKSVILGQMMCWTSTAPADKTLTLSLNAAGTLSVNAYTGSGGPATLTASGVLAQNLARGVWHDVVCHVKFANNGTGVLRVWFGGAPEAQPTFAASNISLGNGVFDSAHQMRDGAYVKWGLYCWDVANYTAGEVRVAEFDDVAYLVGNPVGAFAAVKPERYGIVTLLAEDFEQGAPGDAPAGWTLQNAAATSVTVEAAPGGAGRALRFTDDNASGMSFARRSFAAQSGRFTASWRFFQSATGDRHRMLFNQGPTSVFELYTVNGRLICVRPDGGSTDLGAIPVAAWHEVVLAFDVAQQRATVALNGTVRAVDAPFRVAATALDRFAVGTSNPSVGAQLFLDELLIER